MARKNLRLGYRTLTKGGNGTVADHDELLSNQTRRHDVHIHPRLTCQLRRSTEFTDDEISAAFKFLDLDHNLHIGAAEIRHILICMGELITDDEVCIKTSWKQEPALAS